MNAIQTYGSQIRSYSDGALSFLNSDGLIPQLLITVIVIVILHVVIAVVENVIEAIQKYRRLKVEVFPNTYPEGKAYIQRAGGDNQLLYPSDNELNGMEFSYSCHIYIDKKTYENMPAQAGSTENFRTLFYKGSNAGPGQGTSMAPGVFLSANTNKIRIYMTTVVEPVSGEFIELTNIPVGKWFHLVLVQKGKYLDAFINGNIAARHAYTSVPKLNYGGIYLLSNGTTAPNADQTSSALNVKFIGEGFKGYVSRLTYYSYAISFSEIDSSMRVGPSSKIETTATSNKNRPPYLHDSWWVTNY